MAHGVNRYRKGVTVPNGLTRTAAQQAPDRPLLNVRQLIEICTIKDGRQIKISGIGLPSYKAAVDPLTGNGDQSCQRLP